MSPRTTKREHERLIKVAQAEETTLRAYLLFDEVGKLLQEDIHASIPREEMAAILLRHAGQLGAKADGYTPRKWFDELRLDLAHVERDMAPTKRKATKRKKAR